MARKVPNAAKGSSEEMPGALVSVNKRRQKILDSAIKLFARNGFRGTTTKEIALAAGVNEVTIFRHFANKQELYRAILEVKSTEAGITTWVEELAQFAERRDDEGLCLFIARKILDHYRRDPDFLLLKLYSSLEGHELAREYRERQICPLYHFLKKYIKTRQSEGAFHQCNPDIAVSAFIGGIFNHAMSIHFSDLAFLKLTEKETALAFTEVFLKGMQAQPGAEESV
jgi:AcrR family transcriptional regulator